MPRAPTASSCTGVLAAAAGDLDGVTVAAGDPAERVPATAILVRPDSYVAWASSSDMPDVEALAAVPWHWFGIASLCAHPG